MSPYMVVQQSCSPGQTNCYDAACIAGTDVNGANGVAVTMKIDGDFVEVVITYASQYCQVSQGKITCRVPNK